MGRVDIITGTLGKALGGAAAANSARKEIVELCASARGLICFRTRWRRRRGGIAQGARDVSALDRAARQGRGQHALFPRRASPRLGLTIRPGTHPIVPVMLGRCGAVAEVAARMLEKGIYVIGFSYPVVPKGTARIRTQMSAAHSPEDLEFAIRAFGEVKAELGI